VDGIRGYEILPAGEGTFGMNRTGLILEERARDAEPEVLEAKRPKIRFSQRLRPTKLIQQSGRFQPLLRFPKSGGYAELLLDRKPRNERSELFRFINRDGNKLSAAGAATLSA
jgi:hypothetical protein